MKCSVLLLMLYFLRFCSHIQGLPVQYGKEDVTQELSLSFVTARSEFLQRDMPEIVLLNVTMDSGVTRLVTLIKRPRRFHEVPLYVFQTDDQVQKIQYSQLGLSQHEELTWYITRPNTNPQMAVCIVRSRTDDDVAVQLKNESLVAIDGNTFSLRISQQLEKNTGPEDGNLWSQKYHMIPRSRSLPPLPAERAKRAGGPNCLSVYVDVCLHVDFDMYKKKGSVEEVRVFVTDMMNEVQMLYDKVACASGLPYGLRVELTKIFVEETFATDPIKLRSSTKTQAVFDGVVYQNILNAHDLLTIWLKKNDQPECDHYALLTGTEPADFEWNGKQWLVYTTPSLGLAWNTNLCSHTTGKFCSVLHDLERQLFLITAHEIGHSLGLSHDQRTLECWNWRGYVMDESMGEGIDENNSRWSKCSIQLLKIAIPLWLSVPGCLSLHPTDPQT